MQDLNYMNKKFDKNKIKKIFDIQMKICAGIIGSGIGIKHFDAIQNYKKSFCKIYM